MDNNVDWIRFEILKKTENSLPLHRIPLELPHDASQTCAVFVFIKKLNVYT